MHYPLVSLMTPVKDRAVMMQDTVNSMLHQTYFNTEIILVESDSTDNTWKACENYAYLWDRISAYQIEEEGQYPAYQKCVEVAKGEIGAFVWSDDTISPEYLEKMVPLLTEDVGFVYCPARVGDEVLYKLHNYKMTIPSSNYLSMIFNKGNIPVSPGCAIFRIKDMAIWDMDAPEDIREYPECGLDLALFILIARKYPFVAYHPEPMAQFTAHEGSITIANYEECKRKYNIVREWLK